MHWLDLSCHHHVLWPCPRLPPRPHLSEPRTSCTIIMPVTRKTQEQKTLTGETGQEGTDDINQLWAGHCISCVTLCHKVWYIDYPSTWSVRKRKKKIEGMIYEDPRVIITARSFLAPPLLLLLFLLFQQWSFLGFLRDVGCPLGGVLVQRGCQDRATAASTVNDHLLWERPFFNEDGCGGDPTGGVWRRCQAGV